jgi:hypothetical protein
MEGNNHKRATTILYVWFYVSIIILMFFVYVLINSMDIFNYRIYSYPIQSSITFALDEIDGFVSSYYLLNYSIIIYIFLSLFFILISINKIRKK